MDRLRIGVIGLGWFGEIHTETIVGVPNLELAALCTRTPDRLAAMGEKFGVKALYRDYHDMLADPDIDTPAAQIVEQGQLYGETHRMMKRHLDHREADTDARGLHRELEMCFGTRGDVHLFGA